jgi:hypothetical protein
VQTIAARRAQGLAFRAQAVDQQELHIKPSCTTSRVIPPWLAAAVRQGLALPAAGQAACGRWRSGSCRWTGTSASATRFSGN